LGWVGVCCGGVVVGGGGGLVGGCFGYSTDGWPGCTHGSQEEEEALNRKEGTSTRGTNWTLEGQGEEAARRAAVRQLVRQLDRLSSLRRKKGHDYRELGEKRDLLPRPPLPLSKEWGNFGVTKRRRTTRGNPHEGKEKMRRRNEKTAPKGKRTAVAYRKEKDREKRPVLVKTADKSTVKAPHEREAPEKCLDILRNYRLK